MFPYFNSRAREGATSDNGPGVLQASHFNSRAREGATAGSRRPRDVVRHFNSRAREGATSSLRIATTKLMTFQLTRP